MHGNQAEIGIAGLTGIAWAIACVTLLVGLDGELTWLAIILLGLFTFASCMLWKTVFARETAPLTLMFWLFHTNFLLLPAFSQVVHRTFFWSSYETYREQSLLFACAIITVGLLAFLTGAAWGRKKARAIHFDTLERHFFLKPLSATRGVQLFLAIILAGVMGIVLNMGTDFFMVVREVGGRLVDTQTETGLLRSLPRAAAVAVLLFCICFMVQRRWQGGRIPGPMLMIFCAALGLNVIVNYPLGLSRFWFFGMIISLIWIVKPLRSSGLRATFVIGMTTLQFTLLPWFSQITRGSGLLGFDMEALRRYLHHGDFDGFQTIVNSLIYIQEAGFEYGRSLLSAALFFVPRDFWNNKAEPLGASAAEHLGYPFTNLSAPIYGEFYIDFGLISLLLGMGILGYGMRLLDSYYNFMIRQNRYGIGVILASVLAGYLIILLRGSLLAVISSIATLFGILLIATWLGFHSAVNRDPSGLFVSSAR